jgi:hypothetical protein
MRNLCRSLLHSRWTTITGLVVCALILTPSITRRWSRYRLPRAYRMGEEGIAGGSLEKGKAELETYLADHPKDHYALRLYGVTLINLGEKELGISFLEKSLKMNPHQPSLVRYLESVGRAPQVSPCPESATPTILVPGE